MQPSFQKPPLSITFLGKKTFFTGLFIGLGYTITLLLFFAEFREIDRLISSISYDEILIFNQRDETIIRLCYCFTATVLGMSMTIHYWFRRKRTSYLRFISTQSMFIVWFFLFCIMSFKRQNPEVVAYQYYSEILIVLDDYKILLWLLPLHLFLYNWGNITRKFKARKWVLFSGIIITTFSLLLYASYNLIVSQKFTEYYIAKNQWKLDYITSETQKAKTNYNINFDEATLNTLKKNHIKASNKQIELIRNQFKESTPIDLESILIAKMIVHNNKSISYEWNRSKFIITYPHPYTIFKQLQCYSPKSNEYYELVELFKLEATHLIDEMNDPYLNERQRNIILNIHSAIYHVSDRLELNGDAIDRVKQLPPYYPAPNW